MQSSVECYFGQMRFFNVISIPARYTSIPQAVAMVETFLTTEFEGGRHANRVNKIACK